MVDYKLLDELVAPVEDVANETGIDNNEQAKELIEQLAVQIRLLLPIKDESDRDNFAMAFISMVFIIKRYGLDSMLELSQHDKIYMDLFEKVKDKNLVNYLKLISSDMLGLDTLNKAIELEPNCAIGYYLKAVVLLSNLKSIKDIQSFDSEEKAEILICMNNMKELGFLMYKEFYTEGLVTIHHDFMGNRDDFDLDIILSILEYEQQLAEKSEWDVIYENYLKNENINWEQADGYLLDYFGQPIYNELAKYECIMRVIKSGEYFWNINIQKFEDLMRIESGNIDLTSLAVSYFKVVEMYLFEKVFELGKGKKLTYFDAAGKVEKEISDSSYQTLRENSTIGNYKWFIMQNRNIMLRFPQHTQNLIKKIQHWADNIRNSKLHKNDITYISDLKMVKEETKKLLNLLVVNFK